MFRVLVAILSAASAVSAAGTPGKLAVWSQRVNNQRRTNIGPAVKDHSSYDTRTIEVETIAARVNELTKDAEVVVFIKHAEKRFPSVISDSIKSSNALNIFPHVYHSASSKGSNALSTAVLSTPLFKGAKSDLSELNHEEIFTDSKLDAFVVDLKSEDVNVMDKLAEIGERKKVVFVAVEEPTAIAPARKAEYSRLLDNEDYNDMDISDDELYLPEGTEFTLFYAGYYLYLTPDIFTGIMTMLFMFFVGLIGYSCLGDIQGNSHYPSKLPPLGKEG